MRNSNFRLIFLVALINSQLNTILTQNSTSITTLNNNQLNLDYDGILGVGWGVFAIICSVIVGIMICIYGFSTTNSLVFYSIGFFIPIIMFFIMAFTPLEVDGATDIRENQGKNSLIIFRWLVFSLVLSGLLTIIIPFMKLWTIVLIPQRVDSRTQKEYLDKVERIFSYNKKDKANESNKPGEGNSKDKKMSIFNEPEILPLNNQNIFQNERQDIEMANFENLANKERKRKLGALKRRINDEEN